MTNETLTAIMRALHNHAPAVRLHVSIEIWALITRDIDWTARETVRHGRGGLSFCGVSVNGRARSGWAVAVRCPDCAPQLGALAAMPADAAVERVQLPSGIFARRCARCKGTREIIIEQSDDFTLDDHRNDR